MARNLEDTGKHLIRILRQGGKASKALGQVLLDGRDDILTQVSQAMRDRSPQVQVLRMVHKEVGGLQTAANDLLTEHGLEAAQYQSASSAAYLVVLGLPDTNEYRVTKKFVREVFKKPMLAQNVSVADLISGQMASMDMHLVNVTRQAYSSGSTIHSVSKFIRAASGQLDDATLRRKADALARTSISRVANSTRYETFSSEEGVKGVIYTATLDHRTSNVCKVLDGTYWSNFDDVREPPLHVGCRSTLVPVLKGESLKSVKEQLMRPAVEPKSVRQLEEQGLHTRNNRVRKPSRTDRSPLKGVVKQKYVTYEQWIKTQPVTYQREILGTKAYGEFSRTGSLRKALGVAE